METNNMISTALIIYLLAVTAATNIFAQEAAGKVTGAWEKYISAF
jgi:hypothetical protein